MHYVIVPCITYTHLHCIYTIYAHLYIGAFGGPMLSIKKATPYWIAGNLFQSLWCGVFRPAFINSLWLPASQLLLGAISFNYLHESLTNSIISEGDAKSRIILYLIRFPVSLHGSWLCGATLLNLNSWYVTYYTSITYVLSIYLCEYHIYCAYYHLSHYIYLLIYLYTHIYTPCSYCIG